MNMFIYTYFVALDVRNHDRIRDEWVKTRSLLVGHDPADNLQMCYDAEQIAEKLLNNTFCQSSVSDHMHVTVLPCAETVLVTVSEMAERNPPALLLLCLLCGSALCLVRKHCFKDFHNNKNDNVTSSFFFSSPQQNYQVSVCFSTRDKNTLYYLSFKKYNDYFSQTMTWTVDGIWTFLT